MVIVHRVLHDIDAPPFLMIVGAKPEVNTFIKVLRSSELTPLYSFKEALDEAPPDSYVSL